MTPDELRDLAHEARLRRFSATDPVTPGLLIFLAEIEDTLLLFANQLEDTDR